MAVVKLTASQQRKIDQITELQKTVSKARTILAARQIAWDVLEPAGDPAKTIEKVAEEGGYDTVIMGSRGLGTAARVLQGSVSEHVATHANATVVIVH